MNRSKALPALLSVLFGVGACSVLSAQAPSFSPLQALATQATPREVRVVIMADSQTTTGNIKGVNSKVFGRLLELARKRKPDALFLAGDLVGGLKPSKPYPKLPKSFEAEEDEGNPVFQYEYDQFLKVLKKHFGTGIPFYPISGNHDTRVLGSTKAFQKTFGLPPIRSRENPHARLTAYGVSIEGVRFCLPALEYFDLDRRRGIDEQVPGPVVDWLEKDLAEHRAARYRFVISHEPVFSGKRTRPGRERVARLLEAGKVSGYFCGHWHRYQRSKHGDTWQIVTGGAGGRMDKQPDPGDFSHYTLLTIPADGSRPRVTIHDLDDRVRDSFTL